MYFFLSANSLSSHQKVPCVLVDFFLTSAKNASASANFCSLSLKLSSAAILSDSAWAAALSAEIRSASACLSASSAAILAASELSYSSWAFSLAAWASLFAFSVFFGCCFCGNFCLTKRQWVFREKLGKLILGCHSCNTTSLRFSL